MELFLDNDIILKLSAINSLNKIENIFKVKAESVYVLPSAFGYIKNSKRVREKYSTEIISKALKAIKNYSIIPDDYISDEKFLKLSGIDNIDSGEKILFSLSPASKDFLILTGDKRSIQELGNNSELEDIRDSLKSKIVCLEKLFLLLLEIEYFKTLLQDIKNSNFCGDITLKVIFNQGNPDFEKVKSGLSSYYEDLRSKSGKMLY